MSDPMPGIPISPTQLRNQPNPEASHKLVSPGAFHRQYHDTKSEDAIKDTFTFGAPDAGRGKNK